MIQAIEVPEIGENVESGVVVAVHVKAGDTVAVDDTVIELETDKALVEIPSPFTGRITEVLAEAGAQMKVGDVIARIETDAEVRTAKEAASATVAAGGEAANEPAAQTAVPATALPPESPAAEPQPKPEGSGEPADRPPAPAAPSIRRLARELGIDIHDVGGSGPRGRITENDVKATVKRQRAAATGETGALPDFSRRGTVDIEEMETVRRLTARKTAASWAIIPHVTQFDEADITDVLKFIEKNSQTAQKAGAKLTVTAVITRISAEALKRFPRFNASIDMAANRIIFKRYVNIGIAADTPRGLLVPVLRDADRKSIIELAKAIGDLAERARNKKIKPDELQDGTFTISNQGSIGGVGFTPIVLWPQVAILGVSRSSIKPVYQQDRFEPRSILPLALSYDHRIIDGADAARFLRWICDGLEQPLALFLD